jgi:hypothetical protein
LLKPKIISLLKVAGIIFLSTIPIFICLRLTIGNKPQRWTYLSERYGLGLHFLLGKTVMIGGFDCMSGSCRVEVGQRNCFGPFYYERRLKGTVEQKRMGEEGTSWKDGSLDDLL